MSDRHPILGQEYRVQDVDSDLLGTMADADSAVPVGEDEYGNLIVEQFTDGSAEANRVVWTAKNFREAVANGGLVVE